MNPGVKNAQPVQYYSTNSQQQNYNMTHWRLHNENDNSTKWKVLAALVGKVLTRTSGYAFSYAQVQREVSVQQRDAILVYNVSGRDAPEVAQSPLLGRV